MKNLVKMSTILSALILVVVFFGCVPQEQTEEVNSEEQAVQPVEERPSTEDMIAAAEATDPVAEDAGTIGSTVYDFAVDTYYGGTFTAEDLKGKVTLLVFWFPT